MPSSRIRVSLSLVSLSLLSTCASAGQRFDGEWGYRQSCGFEHTANLVLRQQGASVTGEWDDGTRVAGDSGKLQGDARADNATVRFCSDGDAGRSTAQCPQFGTATDTFSRVGDTLVWSRKSGTADRPYLTLHRADIGKAIPVDDQCDDDAGQDDSDTDMAALDRSR